MKEETKKFHKELAVKLFNRVWDLLDKNERTNDENYEMIHSAHTSLYHWLQIGSVKEFNVGEWQISRVYAVLNMSESSLYHAKRSLEYALDENVKFEPFYLAYSYEAMARAYSIKGNKEQSNKYISKAKETSNKITDKETKEMILKDIESINL